MFSYEQCNLCPRLCGIDRKKQEGACHAPFQMKIARAALHFWEEPCISGECGSGTVFFSGCNLGCVYCQNQKISRNWVGNCHTPSSLAEVFLGLEKEGAHNINLVTPTHHWLSIKEAVRQYRQRGGSLPIVYNTSGYERKEVIDALEETVDIYLTDLKYAEKTSAKKYSGAPDYPSVARQSLQKMVKKAGAPIFDEKGMLLKGVIVRLLVLPSLEYEAMMNLAFLKETFGDRIILSLMNQYTPVGDHLPQELLAPLPPASYQTVVDYAHKLGFKYAYMQEGETAKESFIPDFEG